jgi:TolB-like protein
MSRAAGVVVLLIVLASCATEDPAVVQVEPVVDIEVPEEEKKVISVMKFDDRSIETEKFKPWQLGIPDMIMEALGAIPYYRVISREYMIEKVLDEQEFQLAGVTDATTAVRVGQLLNAEFILIGAFQVFQETLQINAKVLTVETGEIVAQANSLGALGSFYVVHNEIAIKITEAFSLDIDETAKKMLREKFDTSVVDASLANYSGEEKLETIRALEREDKTEEARKVKEEARSDFETALELDSEYERARQNLTRLGLTAPMTL